MADSWYAGTTEVGSDEVWHELCASSIFELQQTACLSVVSVHGNQCTLKPRPATSRQARKCVLPA